MPIVSAVIPAYNAARWIGETLQSVLSQELSPDDLEIIVVDDGSQDDTARVASILLRDCVYQNRIETIANGGPAKARILGATLANAPWIQFLDADDLLGLGKLRSQIGVLSAISNRAAVVFSEMRRFRAEGAGLEYLGDLSLAQLDGDPAAALIGSEFIQLGSAIIRREAIFAVGGMDSASEPIEDVNLLLRLAANGYEFVPLRLGQVGLLYRVVDGSWSHASSARFWRGVLYNAQYCKSCWSKEMSPSREAALARVFFSCARELALVDTVSARRAAVDFEALRHEASWWLRGHIRILSRWIGLFRTARILAKISQTRGLLRRIVS